MFTTPSRLASPAYRPAAGLLFRPRLINESPRTTIVVLASTTAPAASGVVVVAVDVKRYASVVLLPTVMNAGRVPPKVPVIRTVEPFQAEFRNGSVARTVPAPLP